MTLNNKQKVNNDILNKQFKNVQFYSEFSFLYISENIFFEINALQKLARFHFL